MVVGPRIAAGRAGFAGVRCVLPALEAGAELPALLDPQAATAPAKASDTTETRITPRTIPPPDYERLTTRSRSHRKLDRSTNQLLAGARICQSPTDSSIPTQPAHVTGATTKARSNSPLSGETPRAAPSWRSSLCVRLHHPTKRRG